MNILLITPPMTQPNTPYPAMAYLANYLAKKKYSVEQRDFGLEILLKLFSPEGISRIHRGIKNNNSDSVQFFLDAFEDYRATIAPTLRFLQGKDPTLALRIAARTLLPEGPRFLPLVQHDEILSLFGSMGVQDKAKYLASLYIDDLADVIREGVDEHFEFSKYGESLVASQISFSPLYDRLNQKGSLVDELLQELVDETLSVSRPDVVGLTCPFPGNVYSALRLAQIFKRKNPKIKTVMGGGFVNTELRELNDKRFFEFIDYLIFDDGERPLDLLLRHLENKSTTSVESSQLLRTWYLQNDQIIKGQNFEAVKPKVSEQAKPKVSERHTLSQNTALIGESNIPFKDHPGPSFSGLKLNEYISMLELPNPMHRMWSDFRWNKMILAHGCYWKKCTFCDVSLDYIKRFEPGRAADIVDQIERIIDETGTTGFHFVDEAAPPALLKSMCSEILRRKLKINWWGNLRFDPQFTAEVTNLMADAGCVAVTGGLEVASPRILKLINKGVDIAQVAQVTKNFKSAGVYVHVYLMYGFPTQNEQETVDSLEVVRQMFKNGCIDSGFWHRFLATCHSPVGKNPQQYGIELLLPEAPAEGIFAKNALPFSEKSDVDHDRLGQGLAKAIYNYMHDIGLDEDVRYWFQEWRAPKSTLPQNYIKKMLART